MKNFAKVFIAALVLVLWGSAIVWAGQNASAGIRIDLNSSTSGNQNQTSISPPAVGSYVRVDIYVVNASNLDTYEFDLNYNSSDLEYTQASEDQPSTFENNFLKKDGGSTIGWTVDTSVPGVVNISNTLVGNDPAEAPEGEGLLASIVFKVLQSPPGNLTFGDVDWYDNAGVKDVCTDKGEASLPVQMTNISATSSQEEGVILTWRTESELNCAGFHVWRGEKEESEYGRITTALIPGQGNSSTGHEYSYTDRNVEDGVMYWYKVEEVSTDGSSRFHGPISVEGISLIPIDFSLSQNYPNPFNPETTIKYQIPIDCKVRVAVYNIMGRKIIDLVDENKKAGYYSTVWNGNDEYSRKVSSGVYFIQITAGDFHNVRKMSLMR